MYMYLFMLSGAHEKAKGRSVQLISQWEKIIDQMKKRDQDMDRTATVSQQGEGKGRGGGIKGYMYILINSIPFLFAGVGSA